MLRNKPLASEAFAQIDAGPPGRGALRWEHPQAGSWGRTRHKPSLRSVHELPAVQERGFSLGYPEVSSKPVHHLQLKLIGNLALPYLRGSYFLRHAARRCQFCPAASRSAA